MRTVAAVVVAAGVSAFGAVLLGEQPLEGLTALIAGALFGVAVAEAAVTVSRYSDGYLAAAAALLAQAGMVWALYIETGHHLDEAPPEAWAGVVLAAASAAGWLKSAARRGRGRPPAPSRTPDG